MLNLKKRPSGGFPRTRSLSRYPSKILKALRDHTLTVSQVGSCTVAGVPVSANNQEAREISPVREIVP